MDATASDGDVALPLELVAEVIGWLLERPRVERACVRLLVPVATGEVIHEGALKMYFPRRKFVFRRRFWAKSKSGVASGLERILGWQTVPLRRGLRRSELRELESREIS